MESDLSLKNVLAGLNLKNMKRAKSKIIRRDTSRWVDSGKIDLEIVISRMNDDFGIA